jgi:hypothetical protein
VGRGRRILRNVVFYDLCVGKDGRVMAGEMDSSVTCVGEKRN